MIVGPAGDALDGIVGVGLARDELGGRQRRQVPAGGKTDDHDAIGIDVVIGGAGPHRLHRPPRIEQRHRQQVSVGTEPVLQDKSAKAARRKPVGHLPAFEIRSQARHRRRPAAPPPPSRSRVPAAGAKIVSVGMSSQALPLACGASPGHRRMVWTPRNALSSPAVEQGCFCAPADRGCQQAHECNRNETLHREPRFYGEDYSGTVPDDQWPVRRREFQFLAASHSCRNDLEAHSSL